MLRWKSSLKPASGGGGVGTDPATLNGLVLQLNADTDVFSDAGITPAVDGDSVQEWHDQSGSGNDATNSGSGKPVFETTGIASLDTILWDSASEQNLISPVSSAMDPVTMLFVVEFNNLSATRAFINSTATGGWQGRVDASGGLSFIRQSIGGFATTGSGVISANTPYVIAFTLDSGNNWRIHVGSTVYSGTSTDSPSGSGTVRLGSRPFGERMDGFISDVYLYNQSHSQSDLADAITFLETKYSGGTIVPTVVTSANSSNTTTTIDCSSIAEGHLMIILVCLWSTRQISSYPSSWNLERLGNEGTSGGQSDLYAFSKIASATETSYDFTVNDILFGDRFSYSLLEIPKTGLGVRNATYSQDGTLGSLYSYSTDTLHLAFCGKADYSATEDVIHPSGYTEIVDRTGSQYNHAIAYKTISGASRALHSGYEFTDPDNTGGTGDNNLSTIHLSISDAGPIVSESFEGTGTPVGFTNSISGSGTVDFDNTTYALDGSQSLKVYSDSDTFTYVDLGHDYDHMVAIFGYRNSAYPDSLSNRQDVFFIDSTGTRTVNNYLAYGAVSGNTNGIIHGYSAIVLTLTGTVNTFHYVRVEIDRSGGVVKIARSNDKTSFPTSGTNYAEDLTASFSANFSGTRYIGFGALNLGTVNRHFDDLEVTGEL